MYYTIESERMNYAKHIRECEKQWMYEKSIVCSVPVQEIGSEQDCILTTNRWEPG